MNLRTSLTPALIVLAAATSFALLNGNKSSMGHGKRSANRRFAQSESIWSSQTRSYPYGGPTFTSFVSTSFRDHGAGTAQDFYNWMDKSFANYKADPDLTWAKWVTEKQAELANVDQNDANAVADEEQKICEELHKNIKKTIPHFSLERGFEFYYTVNRGERQCFLQSIVVAGLLQKIGINAGVDMVWRNMSGDPSNNGHAVCVTTLKNGQQILVDCSEPDAFATHKGLFAYVLTKRHYMFLEPSYADQNRITDYQRADDGGSISDKDVRTLDIAFLRSQFDYYRGERASRGIFDESPTRAGLKESAKYLARAADECSQNPLAVYQLGRTLEKLGDSSEAKKDIFAARHVYAQAGWIPSGERDAIAEVAQDTGAK